MAYANGYLHRKLVTVPAANVKGSTDLTDFPLVFRHIHADYKDLANGGKVHYNSQIDIRFETLDGTKLTHFLERWNNITGEVIGWVRMPTLSANSDTQFYIYYGKDIASTEENDAGVWSSVYKGVWHLWENPGGAAPQMLDSTTNGNHGTANGGMTLSNAIEGKLGRGINLNGSQYINVPDSASLRVTGDLTVSYWMRPSGSFPRARRENPVHKAYGGEFGHTYEVDGGLSYYHGSSGIDGGTYQGFTSDARIRENEWHYVTFVRNTADANVYIYVDGGHVGTQAITIGRATSSQALKFGAGYVNNFTGDLDEIRYAATARSIGWIATEFDNQKDPDNFFVIEDESNTFVNGYGYRRKISTDYTKVAGTSNHSHFIMLVSLTLNDLKSEANGGKVKYANSLADIRFESVSGDRLDHEIDSYDPTTGALIAWVRIPSLSYNSATNIYMYYGKTIDLSEENAYAVFNVRNIHLVYHGNAVPDANTTTKEFYDSSQKRQLGSGRGSMTSGQRVAGKIGYATNFDGSNDTIDVTGHLAEEANGSYRLNQNMSISVWVKLSNATKQFKSILESRSPTVPVGALRLDYDGTNGHRINLVKYGVVDQYVSTGALSNGTWYRLDVVQGATSVTYYLNGVSLGSFSNSSAFNATATRFDIGGSGDLGGNTNYFPGDIDEFRFYHSQLSANLILTEYRNQNDPATFYSVGNEEAPVVSADTQHGQTVDGGLTLVEHKTISLADALHSHTAESVILTQEHNLVVADALQAHSVDSLGVFPQNTLLVVADATHGHTVEELLLIDGGLPVPHDALHGHSADNIVLTQRHFLSVASADHGHTVENVIASQAHTLADVADALHAHGAEPVILTQSHFLAISDALHAQTADNVSLFQRHVLAVQDALQAHLADSPYVYTLIPIVVQDAHHGHFVDATLVQVWKKRKPNSVLPTREIPRIMIIDNTERIQNNPQSKTKPRGAAVQGMKPVILSERSLPRVRDFPK